MIDPLARGGVSELEALSTIRGLPVLVVADPSDPLPAVLAARALGNGPWDVVYRGAPLEEVLMRIERLRAQAEGLVELDEMRFAAVHDDRTRLLRPVPFNGRLREHFSAAQRHHIDLALVLFDLDRFGQVNKKFDHTVGDSVIDRVGTVVRENLRAEDVGGRVGGDEFAIVLPYTSRIDAARVVHRIHAQVRALTGPFTDSEEEVAVSASVGFETFDGRDLETVEALRRHAEQALRRAKELGGDKAIYFRNLEHGAEQQARANEATGS
ncbi:MAG: GGDEF domain-containing protein [Planctomycetota bacterium]|nr:GGDEF domain-containing protein [Planctomycetota bacterium]